MVEDFVPSGFVPYFPELIYVHSAFAAVVLLKVRISIHPIPRSTAYTHTRAAPARAPGALPPISHLSTPI